VLVTRRRFNAVERKLRKEKKRRKKVEDLLQAERLKNAVLMERLDLVANHILPEAPPRAREDLYVSEEREDLEYQLQSGQIDRGEYQELLKEAGLLSHEIEIDTYGVPTVI
jgi:hypothetical protein